MKNVTFGVVWAEGSSSKMRVGCDLRGVLKVDIWVKLPCAAQGITSRKSEKVLKLTILGNFDTF